ncbi:putative ribonuclease H-like domain-containing protein [Tanacetum coccineum]
MGGRGGGGLIGKWRLGLGGTHGVEGLWWGYGGAAEVWKDVWRGERGVGGVWWGICCVGRYGWIGVVSWSVGQLVRGASGALMEWGWKLRRLSNVAWCWVGGASRVKVVGCVASGCACGLGSVWVVLGGGAEWGHVGEGNGLCDCGGEVLSGWGRALEGEGWRDGGGWGREVGLWLGGVVKGAELAEAFGSGRVGEVLLVGGGGGGEWCGAVGGCFWVYVTREGGLGYSDFKGSKDSTEKERWISLTASMGTDYHAIAVYVDDIIFGSTNKELCTRFEKSMKDKFQMSSMGELTFFLGLQVQQKKDGIFISHDKYVAEILNKFNYSVMKSASTPVDLEKPLVKDGDADDVDVHLYRSMIGSLMYLTTSRPYIMFACKKQTVVATSITKAEYVVAANCHGQVLWIQNQLLDYRYNFMNTVINIDNNNLLTKGFDAGRFQYLVSSIGMLNP